jgi:8-oxo-dGTP pyrophosphatase MutT (NUDIX family)
VTLAAAGAREVAEETGLVVQCLPDPVLLSRHTAPCRPGLVDWHLDVQFAAILAEVSPRVSPESLDVAWFDVDDLPEPLADGARHSVERAVLALAELGQPAAE